MPSITLTPDQQNAFDKLVAFVESDDRVFILRGYAGTGKTTLVKIFIEKLKALNQKYYLLASTGRAAKILSNATANRTSTVHSHIYKFKDFNKDIDDIVKQQENTGVDSTGQLYLTFELSSVPQTEEESHRFYIVDEASMISDIPDANVTQALFGSGRLLNDLLQHDRKGKFVFVGDHCQLPPVVRSNNNSFSPALSSEYFQKTYSISAQFAELTNIMRQHIENDIIVASKRVRHLYDNVPTQKWGKLPFRNLKNIKIHPDSVSLINSYIQNIKKNGYNATTLISRTNRKANQLTELIRPSLGMSKLLQVGDLLLITQNNMPTGLMNGDMVVVTQLNPVVKQSANLTFKEVQVQELFTQKTYSHLLIEDLVYSNEVNLNSEQQKKLFIDFFIRMKKKGIRQKTSTFNDSMMRDPYLNGLRAVFGYAITCHKSQGGEWEEVFLDIPRNLTLEPTKSTYQWVYTAMTRAREQLHIVDDFYIE